MTPGNYFKLPLGGTSMLCMNLAGLREFNGYRQSPAETLIDWIERDVLPRLSKEG